MSDNAVIDALFEGVEFEQTTKERRSAVDAEYGKGRWKNATLLEVDRREGQYGRSLTLKMNLTGDPQDPKEFTFFADAPALPHSNGEQPAENTVVRHQIALNKLKTLVHATGMWCTFNARGYADETSWPTGLNDFSDDTQFDRIVAVFTGLIGQKMPINVKYRTYTNKNGEEKTVRDVWGMDARKEG
jgi:hypothetical protein